MGGPTPRIPRTDDVEQTPVASAVSGGVPGPLLGGRYRLGPLLGIGGAGRVYLAVQEPLGRSVAVKVLRSDIDASAREAFGQRFLREAALAGRLQHPNVVTVHDFGAEDDLLYVVMEHLQGRTLADAVRGGRALSARLVARIGIGIARGLRHAHAAGLVHRDVKPGNIMLVPDDDGLEQPVLLDFGLVISRLPGDDLGLTRAGQCLGTPIYTAPEQSRGGDVDGRADVYALGVVLYRALAGCPPFEGPDALSLAMQHQTAPVPRMAELTPRVAVPPALELVVRRALQKDPADRWPDAGALADALERWLSEVDRLDGGGGGRRRAWPRAPWQLAALGGLLSVGLGGLLLLVGLLGIIVGAGLGAEATAPPPELSPPGPPVASWAPPGVGAPGLSSGGPPAAGASAAGASIQPALARPGGSAAPIEPAPVEPMSAQASERPDPVGPAPAQAAGAPASVRPAPVPSSGAPPSAPSGAPPPTPSGAPPPAPSGSVEAGVLRPAPAPAGTDAELEIDGVSFDPRAAERAVRWLNSASRAELEAAGIYSRGVALILDGRPFASIEAFGQTRGVGEKTMGAVAAAIQ